MSSTMINVMAHKEAQATFERHFNYWRNQCEREQDMVVWCPSDAVVKCPGIQIQAVHKAQHIGNEAIYRVFHIFNHIQHLGYDRYAFFEYDSICLGQIPEIVEDFAGNIFMDEAGRIEGRWKGRMFTHPPIIITAEALGRFLYTWEKLGITVERSCWDLTFGLVVDEAKLSTCNFLGNGMGFAANTIHPAQYPDLREAVVNGATMIHGIKTEECLKVIIEADKVRSAIQFVKEQGYKVEKVL